mgnify:CR=1 FL=1
MSLVGDILKNEREKQDLSVKDVENGTNIRSLYISAIEENNYDVLPGEVYLKGFLRSYANFLNIDSDYILQSYKEQKGDSITEIETFQEKQILKPKKKVRKGRVTILFVAVILILVAIFFFFANNDKQSATGSIAKEIVSSSMATVTKTESNKTNEKTNNKVILKAEFIDDCWIQVSSENKVIFEGIVKAGEKNEWKADKELNLKIGNAGAVKLNLNGKDLASLGKNGEVVTKTLSIDTIN